MPTTLTEATWHELLDEVARRLGQDWLDQREEEDKDKTPADIATLANELVEMEEVERVISSSLSAFLTTHQ